MCEKKILVTDSAGFIGFYFSKILLEDGYKVLGMDNMNDDIPKFNDLYKENHKAQ